MKTKKLWVVFFVALTALSLAISCKKASSPNPDGYKYSIPQVYTDGLETASLESVGMSVGTIEEMMDYLKSENQKTAGGHTIHNILIVKDDRSLYGVGLKKRYLSGVRNRS